MDFRKEYDSLGDVDVPVQRLWGAQTQRSLKYFHISTETMPAEIIFALAEIKRSCALVNANLGLLNQEKAQAIIKAADEILGQHHQDEFKLSVWQTGSGTQSNMNMNEVIANRASEILGGERGISQLVNPNDDVNLGQSSNDVFPTAMHLAAAVGITNRILPALCILRTTLTNKSEAFADVIKMGRTHLQDAIPLTLGQEFSGYAEQLRHAEKAIEATLFGIYELAIGGTAVGTGLNTHPEFGVRVAAELAHRSHLPFKTAANKFAAIAAHGALVNAHGALKLLAVALMKIANDVRWMASGPRSGLGEIQIPENEPGSSIMPGKVNPTQCEALSMLCCQVIGNDTAIAIGGASGNFELNVYKPLIAYNFMQSARLLADGMTSFEQYCVRGIEPNRQRLSELTRQSLMLVTALVPHIGYARAAEIAISAHHEECSLKVAAIKLGYVTEEEFESWIVISDMTHPYGKSGKEPKYLTH
ncbi:MAG: class II fumarate hydratase [Gallionella sp.]